MVLPVGRKPSAEQLYQHKQYIVEHGELKASERVKIAGYQDTDSEAEEDEQNDLQSVEVTKLDTRHSNEHSASADGSSVSGSVTASVESRRSARRSSRTPHSAAYTSHSVHTLPTIYSAGAIPSPTNATAAGAASVRAPRSSQPVSGPHTPHSVGTALPGQSLLSPRSSDASVQGAGGVRGTRKHKRKHRKSGTAAGAGIDMFAY